MKRIVVHVRNPMVPAVITLTLISLLLCCFVNLNIFGKNLTGLGWTAISLVSLYRLWGHWGKIRGILPIWSLWLAYIFLRAWSGMPDAWQSTAQIVCPIICALAVSTYRLVPQDLDKIDKYIKVIYLIYLLGYVLIVVPFSLADIDNSVFASGAISALFFQAYFLSRYMICKSGTREFLFYCSALIVPVISVNRGPILASLVFVVLAFLPISLRRRMLILVVATVIGVGSFYTDRVQHKMFFSGHGEITDLYSDNPDLQTNGRRAMWDTLRLGIANRPWLGYGANADKQRLLSEGFPTYLPHNDWLRIQFNYGQLGAILYILTMACQAFILLRKIRGSDVRVRAIGCTAASLFFPYCTVMYTDNVLIYCQFFTVPHMILAGLVYSMEENKKPATRQMFLAKQA